MAGSTGVKPLRIALIGGGPSALMIFQQLVESGRADLEVTIFERKPKLGQGMPYSPEGAAPEHLTNVSGNELPDLVTPLVDWVRTQPQSGLSSSIDEERVVPRLLFGQYLEAQFQALIKQFQGSCQCLLEHTVQDIIDHPDSDTVEVLANQRSYSFDHVIICSGHNWPKTHEGQTPGYFDSPYPPKKLAHTCNHPVALRGSSLTAVDAIRTLSRANGHFTADGYQVNPDSPDFRIVMHTRNGLLPCVRFHLQDPQVTQAELPSQHEIESIKAKNDGFVPLDLVFNAYFKKLLHKRDPELYTVIKDFTLEQLVEAAMAPREKADPFEYFAAEVREAQLSLASRQPVVWKETLAVLSYALNYPAKHFSAEDMLRLKNTLLPLISLVIAFIPQGSSQDMLALYKAGRLDLITVGSDSKVEPHPEGGILYHIEGQRPVRYLTYVDCVGQPHLPLKAFPFPSLLDQRVLSQARVRFRSQLAALEQRQQDPDSVQQDPDGSYHLVVPGAAIDDNFRPLNRTGQPHPRLHLMAVPYMGGHNPDYSGFDFCQEASQRIVSSLLG